MTALFDIADMGYWMPVLDGDRRAYALFSRHYSFYPYRDGRRAARNDWRFTGPCRERMVLLGSDERALFVWKVFDDASGQTGVNCSIFRNESEHRASTLIKEAVALAWQKWPGQRLYTYVNPAKLPGTLPGFCFLAARWRHCGETAGGLLIFERKSKHIGQTQEIAWKSASR